MENRAQENKAFIFIPRDDYEYGKYELLKNSDDVTSTENEREWRYCYNPKTGLLRMVINKSAIGEAELQALDGSLFQDIIKRGIDIKGTVERLFFKKISSNNITTDSVAAELANINALSGANFDVNVVTGFDNHNGCDEYGGILAEKLAEILSVSVADVVNSLECIVFMHWGGGSLGDILQCENEMNRALPKNKRFYSLSTYRNELFYIDAPRIRVSKRCDDLFSIADKFEDVRVAPVLSKCASRVAIESSHCMDVGVLVAYLERFRNRILMSNLCVKKKKKYLDVVAQALGAIKHLQTALKECAISTICFYRGCKFYG